jgi:DNA-binding transcriptional regulator YiaG
MSNIEKINDYQTLTDEQFAEKYNQTKAEFLKEWESENKKD